MSLLYFNYRRFLLWFYICGQMDLVFRGPASSTAGRRQRQDRFVPVSQHLNKNIVVSRPSLPTILTFFVSPFCCFQYQRNVRRFPTYSDPTRSDDSRGGPVAYELVSGNHGFSGNRSHSFDLVSGNNGISGNHGLSGNQSPTFDRVSGNHSHTFDRVSRNHGTLTNHGVPGNQGQDNKNRAM